MKWAWIATMVVISACGPKAGDSIGEGDGDSEAGGCMGAPPSCPLVPGECSESPALCEDGAWVCPRAGWAVPPSACSEVSSGTFEDDGPVPGCSPDDTPPDCWDQGPGICADVGLPATCDGTSWVCEPGWAMTDGPGEACEWPSPEGATLESGSEGTSGGTSSGSETSGAEASATSTATTTASGSGIDDASGSGIDDASGTEDDGG